MNWSRSSRLKQGQLMDELVKAGTSPGSQRQRASCRTLLGLMERAPSIPAMLRAPPTPREAGGGWRNGGRGSAEGGSTVHEERS